ncbi:hypothetical protein HBH98_141620 [Parastagonospora nodorum]|nr:hypothetical protein HBH47_140810 [Parastagonospora nodorum]KAH4343928.1 hypothetical protein HBH98_141620 [Parastagonospora nodorum]KAH4372119.1 hypothetical protein HBH97_134000 [Parastagonospora nodorum]KAH4380523.1 hypothetical protein HBH99_195850 [Parastagonospora nodorum]KAH4901543.1 hypothetical protein HBI80_146200 [Parastagonospora nodorum]
MLVFADSRSQLQAVIGVKSSAITLLSADTTLSARAATSQEPYPLNAATASEHHATMRTGLIPQLLRTVPLYICRSMRFLPNSWQSAALSNQTIPRSLTREW